MILDKLIEKKDLNTYIIFRIKHLQKMRAEMPTTIKDKKQRGKLMTEMNGKIRELAKLKQVVFTNKLKHMSKIYYK